MSDDLNFRHPFSCIVIGPSGFGKTSFVKRFLLNLRLLTTAPTFAGGIVWCYGEKSAVPSHLPAYVRIHEGVPEDFRSANGEQSLVILDDLLNDVYSNQVCEVVFARYPSSEYKRYSLSLKIYSIRAGSVGISR